MARYVTSVATPMSAAEAFAFMSDVTRFPQWDPGVVSAVRVAGDGTSVGTAYDLTISAGGTSVMRYEVRAYEAPHRLLLVARTSRLASEDEIRVEATPQGAIVTYDAKLTLSGLLGIFDPFLALAFDRIGDRAAVGLRRALRGSAVLR